MVMSPPHGPAAPRSLARGFLGCPWQPGGASRQAHLEQSAWGDLCCRKHFKNDDQLAGTAGVSVGVACVYSRLQKTPSFACGLCSCFSLGGLPGPVGSACRSLVSSPCGRAFAGGHALLPRVFPSPQRPQVHGVPGAVGESAHISLFLTEPAPVPTSPCSVRGRPLVSVGRTRMAAGV